MKIFLPIFFIVMSLSPMQAQTLQHSVFHLGHSLVNPYMPAMLQSLCDDDTSISHDYEIAIINGSPLFYTWANAGTCQGYQASTVNAKTELLSGDYDIFVMTEGVPWDPIIEDFYNYADSFQSTALQGNPTVQTYLYETWNCINTGLPAGCDYDDGDTILWSQRVSQDFDTWRSVADSLSALHPTALPVRIVPAGQCLIRLKDSVDAGAVPGMSNFFGDIFEDDIHLTDTGDYFVALVHYATLYQKSPVGLTHLTTGEWGGAFDAPSPATALKMQQIVWETVQSIPETGVSGTSLGIDPDEQEEDFMIKNQDERSLQNIPAYSQIEVYNLMGQCVLNTKTQYSSEQLTLTELPKSNYIIRVTTPNQKVYIFRICTY